MRVTYDPDKRERALQERGLDFEDAKFGFSGATLEVEDTRTDYGEARIICFGYLAGRSGCGRLHATWRGSSRFQHEESQCPRASTRRAAP